MDGEGATTAAAAMDCSSCNTTSGIEAPATASEQQQEAALPTKRKRPGGDGDEGGDGDGGGDNNGDGNGAQLQPKPKQRPQQQKPPKQKQGQKQKQREQQQQRAPRPEFPPIEVEYRIEGGLRHVVPYVYAFTARAKGRWWGRPVLEVGAAVWGVQGIERGGSGRIDEPVRGRLRLAPRDRSIVHAK